MTHKRYRSNKNTYHEIRDISDRLCKDNELSVIIPQGRTYGKVYSNHFPEKSSASWRDRLQATIDNLIPQSADFEDLLKQMEAQGYKVKRGKHISFCAIGQERFTRAKSLGEGYTEEAIRQRILEKLEPIAEEKAVVKSDMPSWYVPPPTMPLPIPETPTPPTEKPKLIEPLIDIAGNPKYAERIGLEQWAKLRNLKNSAAAFALMQKYGGFDAFSKLYHACRTEVETIENGIAANEKWATSLGYWRKDIATYNSTRKVYNEYKALRKSTKFFAKRTADKFYEKHKDDIIDHENTAFELRDFERPLPKLKDLDAQIEKLKSANVKNNEGLAKKQAELKRLNSIHTHLWHLNQEHQPKPPQREQQRQPQQRKRSYDLER